MRSRVARWLTTALAALTFSSAAVSAQQDQQTFQGVMRPVPPLPPIGLPLPSIGLPLPSIGLPRRNENPRPSPTPQPPDRRGHRRGGSPPVVALLPAYMWVFPAQPAPPNSSTNAQEQPAPGIGTLWLDVEPRVSLQLYVDGYYVGVTDDAGGAVSLTEGPHHVELRGAGWEPQSFNVRIAPDRTITYRAALAPVQSPKTPAVADRSASAPSVGSPSAAPPAQSAPRTPATIYIIPGCYVGNVRPEESKLPAGCDPAKVTTLQR